jgi:hypothetical protein
MNYLFIILNKKHDFLYIFLNKGGPSLKGNLNDDCSFTDLTPCPGKKVIRINSVLMNQN